MNAALASVSAVSVSSRPVLARLARIEMVRYARHPVFLVGFALALASSGTYGPTELDHQVVPAFFLGVLGLVVAARLTVATEGASAVVDAAPVSETIRTAALCLACLVPAGAGAVVVLVHRAFVAADPQPAFLYAGYGTADRALITLVIPVIASAGGPLLGVVAGRWLRFRGGILLALLVLLLWSRFGATRPMYIGVDSVTARALHMLSPYTAFLETNTDGSAPPTLVTAYPASPFWFMVWTVALCGLATTAALWHGARRSARSSVRRTVGGAFVACLVVAVAAVVLAVAAGPEQLTYWTPDGTSSTVRPAHV